MLVPDVVRQPAEATVAPGPTGGAASTRRAADPLKKLKGVTVKVREITIFDNKHGGGLLKKDGDANIYPVFLVVHGGSESPMELKLPQVFNGIRDGDSLPIGNALTIQRSLDAVPDFLDIHVLLMRSLKASRDAAAAAQEALESEAGKGILGTLKTVVSTAAPGVGLAANIGMSLLQLVVRHVGNGQDKQIFYGVGSFEKSSDKLGIGEKLVLESPRLARVVINVDPVR